MILNPETGELEWVVLLVGQRLKPDALETMQRAQIHIPRHMKVVIPDEARVPYGLVGYERDDRQDQSQEPRGVRHFLSEL
jgi:hypothetical protein